MASALVAGVAFGSQACLSCLRLWSRSCHRLQGRGSGGEEPGQEQGFRIAGRGTPGKSGLEEIFLLHGLGPPPAAAAAAAESGGGGRGGFAAAAAAEHETEAGLFRRLLLSRGGGSGSGGGPT